MTLLVAGGAAQVAAASTVTGAGKQLSINVPATVELGATAPITLSLPARVAAVDGRIFFDTNNADVVGVAAVGHGQALSPQQITGGVAFGAYDLHASGNKTVVRISLVGNAAGNLPFRIVLDSAATANGSAIALPRAIGTGAVAFDNASTTFAAPSAVAPRVAIRTPGRVRDLVADGRLAVTDVDVVRGAWEESQADDPCASTVADGDANGDGCVNIVDVQAVLASQSWVVSGGFAVAPPTAGTSGPATQPESLSADVAGATFVVNSAADAVDANNGDGVCADSQGRCTLRAAITEANFGRGSNTINFNLPGSAPVTIQLSVNLPQLVLQDRTGGTLIDGYSQPGSRANTDPNASNAVPGVYLVGTGHLPNHNAFRVTSAFNRIQGLILNQHDRPIVLDGTDAHDNVIAGDWINFNRDGSPSGFSVHYNVWISNGANHNHLGTPALADRNVTGNAVKGSAMYGPGTDYNQIQNNLLCITPSGNGAATCDVGTDFSFGPKHNLIGGSGPGERNVYGPSTQQCIEFAHDNGVESNDSYHNSYNSIIGNWLGFKPDGSYAAAFRCGSNTPNPQANDSNGINIADGSSSNLIQDNYIGSWHDGVNIMMPNETNNTILDNIIGTSPNGQPAPLDRYGIHFRTHTKHHQAIGNRISNAGVYGIALMSPDSTNILLSQNIISNMTGQPIHLEPGANFKIQPPIIRNGTTTQVTGTGENGATIEVYRASRRVGQVGLPDMFVGQGVVGSDGTFNASVSGLTAGDRVTALQIRPDNNTSALSQNVSVTPGQTPGAPTASFTWAQTTGTTVAFHDTSSGAISQWAWVFGDGATSSAQSPSHAYAATGNYTVSLTVTNAGGSTTSTQTVNVQAAPPPPDPGTIAADAFSRTSTSGWGNADAGGKYSVQGTATDYGVANGAGTMNVTAAGSSRFALLNTATGPNVDIKFRVAASNIPAGSTYVVYAVARRNGTSEYRARLTFKADGSVQLDASVLANGAETTLGAAVTVSGLTQSAGGYIWVHAQVTGSSPTTINVRAWADGQAEPGSWQYTVTNANAAVQAPGTVGLRVWVGAKVTNTPVTFSFDDYTVLAL